MRILFSFHPAFGHLFPMLPLARAAVGQGHSVALVGAPDFEQTVRDEVPGADYLAAGAPSATMVGALMERRRGDLSRPSPEFAAWIFGDLRLEFSAAASVAAASAWGPEILVCDEFDGLGPLLAATAGVSWIRFGVGPGDPEHLDRLSVDAADAYYRTWNAVYRSPSWYLDPCPAELKVPGWTTDAPSRPIRSEPHRSARGPAEVPSLGRGRPVALLTLGTVFSDPALLNELIAAIAGDGIGVIATRGLVLNAESVAGEGQRSDHVRVVGMAPLADLLGAVDVVVAAGGSGTVLAAAARGLPMVLAPQGGDQHLVAERASSAGFALLLDDAAGAPGAVRTVLTEPAYRAAATRLRTAIAGAPAPEQVARDLFGPAEA